MIPASNAGFFTCGHSPLFFAVRVQRVNAVCQLRSSLLTFSFYYTFPLPEYLIVPPIYLHPADALYTPQFGSHFPHGINIISFALKFSISIFVFQFAELLIHHCCTFSFQVSHEGWYRHLRRNFQEQMNVIWTSLCIYDFYSFPLTQLSQDFPYCYLFLSIKYFSSILWRKHNVIFAIPFWMR